MKRITIAYVGLVLGLATLWIVADPIRLEEYDFFALRASLINFTGVIAMGAISVAMVVALRLVFIESLLSGLDKSYRLHKWLGVTSLAFAALHFLLANIPKLMIDAGWLEEPAKEPASAPLSNILQFFQTHGGLAEEFGDWGFKIFVVLVGIALIKWFPYRFFFLSHRLLSLLFLFLAFHSLALMDFSYWDHAIAPVMVILIAGGTGAAVISIAGRVGSNRRAVGEIERIQYLESNSVLKLAVRLKGRWEGHEEGQFAFVTFDKREGAHPFTIASPWKGDGILAFFIKGLGDYTQTLPTAVKKGDLVTVEGPYGRFNFDTPKQRQIWVAGGIGIAPFAARIKALIAEPDGRTIDFFYSASERDDDQFIQRITDAAGEANVRLYVLRPKKDGRLDSNRISDAIPDWKEAEFWFCGPAAFGDTLRRELGAKGLSSSDFHQELFEMR